MQNNTLMMKLIAVIMVLILSLGNFLVLVSYAAEISFESDVDISSQDSKTNNKNVQFDSYFKQDYNKIYSSVLDIEDSNKVYINLNLSNNGYLKTGTINFEEESFKIKRQEELSETIQNIDYENNEITLNQINSGTEIELEIPIEITKSEVYNIQNLNKNNKVIFTGIYVTSKGKEIEIEKEIFLELKWDANVEPMLEQSISKYINNVENESIVEFDLKSYIVNNVMPLKETNIDVEVPEIEEKLPKYVKVIGENDFEYNENEKIVKIYMQNLANEQSEVLWKDKINECKLILVYEGLNENEKKVVLNTKVSFDVYGKGEKVEKDLTTELTLNENLGNVNEIEIFSEKESIYKSFMYANSEYETEYKLNWNIDIGYASISDKIIVSDIAENFIDGNDEKIDTEKNTYYKQTIINRKNFEEILGQEGFIKIINEANEEVANITLDITEDENIIINYQNSDLNKIKIETSKPQTEGTLKLEHTKAIKAQTTYERDIIKTFNLLENEVNLNTTYNKVIESLENEEYIGKTEEVNITNINSVKSINLLEPETKVEMNINKNALVTGSINEDVEIYVNLINNEEKLSLFNNPIIDISMPVEIDYLKLKDVKLVFEEELTILNKELYEAEDGTKHIKISLEGTQTKYNIENIISGASLIITADMSLKDMEESKEAEIVAICLNEDIEAISNTNINLVKIEVPEEDEEDGIEQEPEQTPEDDEELNKEPEEEPEGEQEDNQEKNEESLEQEELKEDENESYSEEQEKNTEDNEEVDNTSDTGSNLYIDIESGIDESQELRWGNIILQKITLKNNSNTVYNDLLLYSDIPEGAVFTEAVNTDEDNVEFKDNYSKRRVEWNIDEIVPGETIEKYYNIKIYNSYSEETVEINTRTIQMNAGVNIDEMILAYDCIKRTVKEGDIDIQLYQEFEHVGYVEGDIITINGVLNNFSDEDIENIIGTFNIPKGIKCEDAYISYFNQSSGEEDKYTDGISINENNLNIKIEKLDANDSKVFIIKLKIENKEEIENVNIREKIKLQYGNIIQYSKPLEFKVAIPKLRVTQTRNILEENVAENSIIKYIITVDNIGTCIAENVTITDFLPENVEYIKTETFSDGETEEYNINFDGKTRVISNIHVGKSLTATVIGKVLNDNAETANNIVKVTADGIDEIELNNTINVTGNEINNQHNNQNDNQSNTQDKNQLYNISGQAWLDENSNGIKEDNEKNTGGIKAVLINSNNQIQQTVDINQNGKYNFYNLEKGKYRVIFIYDTNVYGVTKYKVNYNFGNNSDVIETKIQLDGKEQTAGITEIIEIEANNIENIDIGLIKNPKFDLKLEKNVSSITVKNAKDEKVYNYDNKKLAKIEFKAKDIDESTVFIKYKFKITNEGQIYGYATKIVDYIPKELEFVQELNGNWYIGEDNNLYTNVLENEKILPSESKEIELVLMKKMSGEETGIINNKAEIYSAHNNYRLEDIDSIYGNNKANEDDIDYADVYLGIKTGKTILYISLIISQTIILGVGIYLIKKKVLDY